MIYQILTERGTANRQVLNICGEISGIKANPGEEIVFDFAGYKETNPFSNLMIINSLREYRAQNPNVILKFRTKEDGYLSHIAFYQACGIHFGKGFGEAKPSPNYVPITEISMSHDFYRSIDEKAEQLADTLQFDPGLQKMLKYLFVETIRNVFEHAETEKAIVAAQKWPTQNAVEIAISDAGCGIANTLRQFFSTHEENLLRLACKPGVSAKSNYRYLEKDDPWRNSGYGLYIMKELAKAYGGSFMICSGNNALRYSADEYMTEKEETFVTHCRGTTIGIRLRTDTDNDFDRVRRRIVTIGELMSEQIKGAIRSASKSSGGRYKLK